MSVDFVYRSRLPNFTKEVSFRNLLGRLWLYINLTNAKARTVIVIPIIKIV